MQDCCISIANALELLQSCTKSSVCNVMQDKHRETKQQDQSS